MASQEPKGFLGSAPATSEGALGKVDQVHRGPFWGVLDRLKYVRAQILMVKPVFFFDDFTFRLERAWKRPREHTNLRFGAKEGPR